MKGASVGGAPSLFWGIYLFRREEVEILFLGWVFLRKAAFEGSGAFVKRYLFWKHLLLSKRGRFFFSLARRGARPEAVKKLVSFFYGLSFLGKSFLFFKD